MLRTRYHEAVTVHVSLTGDRMFFFAGLLQVIMVLFLLLCCHTVTGQEPMKLANPIAITSHDGLDVGSISSAVVDSNGFLWIAGNHGLQCFDGNAFRTYRSVPNDSTSLLTDNIYHLLYDEERHQLWISTWATRGGLSILDIGSETFTNYQYHHGNPHGIHSNGLFWSCKDKFGTFWLGGGKGLARYRATDDAFDRISFVDDSTAIDSGPRWNLIRCYSQDVRNDSVIWLGTQAGLIKFDVTKASGDRTPIPPELDKDLYGISQVLSLPDGRVLIALWTNGTTIYDPGSKTFSACNYPGNASRSREPINKVTSMVLTSDDHVWIETYGGLVLYHYKKDSLVSLTTVENDGNALFGPNAIDRKGRILDWNDSSIRIYAERRTNMDTYLRNMSADQHFIPRRIVEIGKNELLLASQFSEGLYRVNLLSGDWKVIPPPPSYFATRNAFECWDMLETDSGEYLVLATDQIYQYVPGNNTLIKWRHDPGIRDAVFKRFLQGPDGRIWVGSHYLGLFSIDPATGVVNNFKEELKHEGNPRVGAIWDLAFDRRANLWIRASGYSVYQPARDTFYNFPYFFPDHRVIEHVESLAQGRDGNVWIISTNNVRGVIGITDADHPENGVVSVFDTDDGLKSVKPWRLTVDSHNNVWIASGSGLEKITPDNVTTLYPPWMFTHWSSNLIYVRKNERIVVGFTNGFGLIDRDRLSTDTSSVSPYIHSFRVFDEPLNLALSPRSSPVIQLGPDQNHFSFRISALNPRLFGNVEFQYKLEGVDAQWVQPRGRDYVSYTNIDGGTYLFQLRARRDKGVWSSPYLATFKIGIPWYQSWWARSLAGVLLVGLFYGFYRFNLRQKLAQQETRRLIELDAFKNKFYTNITHEFRTPLTVIEGMADEIDRHPDRDHSRNLSLIKKNSRSLLTLVNQMLDLSRLNAGKIKVSMYRHDVIGHLRQLVQMYESFAHRSGIGLQFYSEEDSLIMDTDLKLLEQALTNILANAIKFTPERGNILVVAKNIQNGTEPLLHILIKDSGVGIPPEELPLIFDRYHQAQSSDTRPGTGIGLALTREIIHVLDGRIEVESVVGKGTTFHIYLPIRVRAEPAPGHLSKGNNRPEPEATSDEIVDSDLPQVLLIEDNSDVLEYLSLSLSEQYHVLTATDGSQGLELAFETLPDIIISDVMMPGLDGYAVCAQLKQDPRTDHIPVIMLTARVTTEDRLQGLGQGADAYLAKPFEREELMIRISNLLEVRKRLQQKYAASLASEASPQSAQEQPLHAFVQNVEQIILDHLDDESFNSDLLASQVFLSKSQLHRKLKALTGMSTSIYIRSVRLHRARELLHSTDMNVTEVSYAVGFNSPAYFSQAFKEAFGASPSSIAN